MLAPDCSGALVVVLDLRTHEAVIEHSDGPVVRVALAPDRAVGEVTREVLTAVRKLGGAVEIDPTAQEVTWSVPLDEDDEHASHDPERACPRPACARAACRRSRSNAHSGARAIRAA